MYVSKGLLVYRDGVCVWGGGGGGGGCDLALLPDLCPDLPLSLSLFLSLFTIPSALTISSHGKINNASKHIKNISWALLPIKVGDAGDGEKEGVSDPV